MLIRRFCRLDLFISDGQPYILVYDRYEDEIFGVEFKEFYLNMRDIVIKDIHRGGEYEPLQNNIFF